MQCRGGPRLLLPVKDKAQRLGHGGHDGLGRLQRGQGDEIDAVRENKGLVVELGLAGQQVPAASSARRVLPLPPGPTRVSSRQAGSRRRSSISASVVFPPDKGGERRGQVVRRERGASGQPFAPIADASGTAPSSPPPARRPVLSARMRRQASYWARAALRCPVSGQQRASPAGGRSSRHGSSSTCAPGVLRARARTRRAARGTRPGGAARPRPGGGTVPAAAASTPQKARCRPGEKPFEKVAPVEVYRLLQALDAGLAEVQPAMWVLLAGLDRIAVNAATSSQ